MMSIHSCPHMINFRERHGSKSFKVIHGAFVACLYKDSRLIKARDCFCKVCHSKSERLHACLYCVHIGCYNAKHIHEHAQKFDHFLAVDLTYGTIYCFQCGDYVYDREFDAIARKQKIKSAQALGMNVYFPWEPSAKEIEILNSHPKIRTITEKSHIGLRGLVNLGNTCFMNCIVQALTHAPLLREFFLADSHNCQFLDDPSMCLVCEMFRLFQEFYSGNWTPHVPYRMLHLLWTHAKHLAEYEQQDAHEFFIATLDVLHEHFKGTNSSNPNQCGCIVCQIFKGKLQSDVICQECKNVSTTYDDMRDISLDLGISSHVANPSGKKVLVQDTEPTSLLDCLERYTRPEHLGSSAKIRCSSCQDYKESVKQLTVKQLPIIASFHFKRFEVTSFLNKKITRYISFPQCLDMTPFMSPYRSINISDNTDGANHFNTFSSCNNKYYLFAVVNHQGNSNSGHYVSYIRQHRDQWFKCDDELITKVSFEEVLDSEGYLLFYHKQILEYESS